ncbi:hypothetical protein Ddc_19119 [Ditylenchus destructor]|nr:hypothetical protein Ddc_19119 [Ditylenchus destructor]
MKAMTDAAVATRFRQGLRAGGAPHRHADARPLQPGLHRLGGWDTHVNQGGATARWPTASRRSAAAWRRSRRAGPRPVAPDHGGGHQRIRPHLPRKRQQGHRPRPRHGVLGARRRTGLGLASGGRADPADRQDAVPGPRLPRPERIPRPTPATNATCAGIASPPDRIPATRALFLFAAS